jgi:hypothetical protein
MSQDNGSNLVIHTLPVLSITSIPSNNLCSGDSLTLNASGALTYIWSGGVVNAQAFVPTISNTYTVTGTDAAGCSASSSTSIVVNPLPVISVSASPNTICEGDASQLIALGADTYNWMPGALSGNPYVQPNQTTTYTVTATNNLSGCGTSATLTVSVNEQSFSFDTVVNCDQYIWNGTTYTAGGVYTYGPIANINGCDSTATLVLTLFQSSSHADTVSATGSYLWAANGQTYTNSGIYSFNGMNYLGCDSLNILNLTILPSTVTFNASLFLQGYYIPNEDSMRTALYNQGQLIVQGTEVDTVQVNLHRDVPPYDLLFSETAILHTHGNLSCNFPATTSGNNYFISITHRNSVNTWSANPVLFSTLTTYDFSASSLQAYGENQVEVEPGVFALFTGDINQDGVVDGLDYNDWENDNNNFAGGYFSTDLNGDGIVDGLDFIYWEQNGNNFVGAVVP